MTMKRRLSLAIVAGATLAGPARMKKRLFAIAASLLIAIGIGTAGAPAYASNNAVCDARIDVAGYGGVTVCYNHAVGVYSTVTLQTEVEPAGFYVILHDWTYDGHAIYVEYQPWSSTTAWYRVVTDIEGGPATQSPMIEQQGDYIGIPIRYLRLRTEGSGAYTYIFKPTSGAGSGNGCGLRGVNGCTYP